MSEAAPGTVVGGDFRILRPLQAGGMGAVYVAEQLSTGKPRALKLMHARLVDDPVQRQRFVREARVAAKIDSEHVVEVLAAGVTETAAIPWLAMELLRGCDLSRLIRENGPLGLAQALPIMEQLCHGLGAAHEAGVVHRDLKPQNVFLCRLASSTRPWAVKVLDFGIAKVVADRNQTTAALGSPAWMAPEQTDTSSDMAPAADVWALGLVLFWMLTGRFYWKAMSEQNAGVQAVLREMLFEPLVPPSERAAELDGDVSFPSSLDDWFLKCVRRNPEERFATANEAWERLRNLTGEEVPPSHILPPEVAELAMRAAEDITPDIAPKPSDSTRKEGGAAQATALPSTRREGASGDADPGSKGASLASSNLPPDVPTTPDSGSGEPGPTLESHELGVARAEASPRGPGWVKWLLASAFAAGAAGAVALSQSQETPATPLPAPTATTVPSGLPSSSSLPSVDPAAGLLIQAEKALEGGALNDAERLAGQVLRSLGAVNGRRPEGVPATPYGDRAQTVLARVALARGEKAAPVAGLTKRAEIAKALQAREAHFAEASIGCGKAKTWLDAAGLSCCGTYLAASLVVAESAADAVGLPPSTWAKKIDAALDRTKPRAECRIDHENIRQRHQTAPPSPSPSSSAPRRPAPTVHGPFKPERAQAALSARAAQAKATCVNYLGQRVHGFSVTFLPTGSVRVSHPSPDDATGKCIGSMLKGIRIPPFDDAEGPQTLTVTVALPK